MSRLRPKIKSLRLIFEDGTANLDGGKIVSESMQFGRAVGFQLEGQRLILTIDEKKADKQLPFDILESLMKLLPNAIREKVEIKD